MPPASGTEPQTVPPYSSAEDNSRVRGNATDDGMATSAAKHDGDQDVHMKDA
jgi:hypothetical protein